MFAKEIDRSIQGVIVVGQDDQANLQQELEEYVITRELRNHFSTFFDVFTKGINRSTDKIGVWISGFFGSGKSHFLKILSYLLENKRVDGKQAVDYFDEKIKDPLVLANMKAAGDIKADLILFNIDSKADIESTSNKAAIVKVFNKVFDEMQGYCATLPWLADLERYLVKEGDYDSFKNRFLELSGKEWEAAREDFYFEEDNIVQTLADIRKMSIEAARNWYQKAEANYAISIDSFALKVQEYIESHGGDHYVIFLADEVGQYISHDSNQMLSLQTIVEELGRCCGGRAWVIVTSQEELDTITRIRESDYFSKIQGRFSTRLNLSSANVDEVIEKRLLEKNDVAQDTLKLLYDEKEAILKNIITFQSEPEMKCYNTSDDFIKIYPFIPYQLRLLQLVFTTIRQFGATGKHLSEGERSILGAVQEVAKDHMEKELGVLIPFSLFYKTIESFLDHNISTVIKNAQKNTRLQAQDIEVLKLLFMLKWVKEMPKTLDNITTLMISHIDEDKLELKKEIEASLDRLVQQTLIQREGDQFIFLTHEEQDVNREIKNMAIDIDEIILRVGNEIFAGILKDKKVLYNSKYLFDFNTIIDDRYISSQKHDMGIRVITPYFDAGVELTESELKRMSANEPNLIINLPPGGIFLEEVEDILKIQRYLSRETITSATEEIRARKSKEAIDRGKNVRTLLEEALREADFYINMQKVDIGPQEPSERIKKGLKVLVEDTYNKLAYITEHIGDSHNLEDLLQTGDDINLFGEENIPNRLALRELIDYVDREAQRHAPVTMKGILDRYSRPPYGWLLDDIRGLIIRLFKAQEITMQLRGEYLASSDKALIEYLTKREHTDQLLINRRDKTPPEHINNAKRLIKDIFNYAAVPGDEDGLMARFKELANTELETIGSLLDNYSYQEYPEKDILEKGERLFADLVQLQEPILFFAKLYELKDNLLDYEDKAFDLKRFFKNQKEQFDKAIEQLDIFEKNKTYIVDEEMIRSIKGIKAVIEADKPYPHIPKLPNLINIFTTKLTEALTQERQPVRENIENDWHKVETELVLYDFQAELYDKFKDEFQDLLARLEAARNFYEVIAMKEESDRLKSRQFEEIKQAAELNKADDTSTEIASNQESKEIYVAREIVNISITNMFPDTKTIESEADIDRLLDYLREKLKAQLRENTTLRLI